MANTHSWTTESSPVELLTTELNSLANDGSVLAAAVNGSGNTYLNLELLVAAQGSARSSGATIEFYIAPSIDGTNFCDETDPIPKPLTIIGLDAATTARRLVRKNWVIPPGQWKIKVVNKTGQAFAASGSVLRYTLHKMQTEAE